MTERQTYAHIFVHGDVLNDAIEALTSLANTTVPDGWDDERIKALQHLVDPLPEVDIYGYLPNIRRSRLLPKTMTRGLSESI